MDQRTDPTGPQCHVLRLMANKVRMTVDGTGWGEVAGNQVSARVVEALDERGLIESKDGGTTYQLTAEGRKWADNTRSKV
jgi:hypothetical protein